MLKCSSSHTETPEYSIHLTQTKMKRTSTLLAGLIVVALIATPVFAETASVNVKNKIEDRNKKTEASTTIKVEQKKQKTKTNRANGIPEF